MMKMCNISFYTQKNNHSEKKKKKFFSKLKENNFKSETVWN